MDGFDPRRHSLVSFAVKEKQPAFAGSVRGEERAMKSFLIGPHTATPPPQLSLRASRPLTAPTGGQAPNLTTIKTNSDAHPKFISPAGKWLQPQIPSLIYESQAQPLTVGETLESTMSNTINADGTRLRPMVAVHSYADISPVMTTQYVKDGDVQDPIATVRRPPSTRGGLSASVDLSSTESTAFTQAVQSPIGSTVERVRSISDFWNRHNGAPARLGIKDLTRTKELGQNVVPGSSNVRLVGGRWRYIQRPAEGDTVYTDYYGRCGEDNCNYYGRRYEMGTADLAQNGLVGDSDYVRVQASMAGIHTLRTRPGLSLDATIVSSTNQSRLDQIRSAYKVREQPRVHRFNEHARMRPATRG